MTITPVRLAIVPLVFLLLLPATPGEAAPKPPSVGEREISSCNPVPRWAMQWFLPTLFLDDGGNVTLIRVPVGSNC